MGARIAAFLALAHPGRVRSLVFGGLGLNMVRGVAGTGPVARALEAESIDDVTNPTARTFRAFAEQTGSDLKALAACIRSSRAPITAEDLARIQCPVLVAVGSADVIGGSAAALAELIPGARAFEIADRDHMKAVGDRTFKEAVLSFLKERAWAENWGPEIRGPGDHPPDLERQTRGCQETGRGPKPGPRRIYTLRYATHYAGTRSIAHAEGSKTSEQRNA